MTLLIILFLALHITDFTLQLRNQVAIFIVNMKFFSTFGFIINSLHIFFFLVA